MDDHDEEKKTEQNLFVRSGKSAAELELDILYYWSCRQTRSIPWPLCDSGATCMFYVCPCLLFKSVACVCNVLRSLWLLQCVCPCLLPQAFLFLRVVLFSCLHQVRLTGGVMFSTSRPVYSSVTKFVYVIFWKRMNRFWCKLVQVVHGGARAWSDQLWRHTVRGQTWRSQKSHLMRYLKIYPTNFNQTWQVHITKYARWVTTTWMQKVKRGRRFGAQAEASFLTLGSSSFSSLITVFTEANSCV